MRSVFLKGLREWVSRTGAAGVAFALAATGGTFDRADGLGVYGSDGIASGLRPVIVVPPGASALEQYAAREVRRYVYLRTGERLRLEASDWPPAAPAILVARKDRALVGAALTEEPDRSILGGLGPEAFWLRTVSRGGSAWVLLAGGDDVGTLYAAYRFAEHLGVRFYLHGDVVPEKPMGLEWPPLDERSAPLFARRGILPFHDFPEGPDWWNLAGYKAVVTQLAKLRMNLLSLHCYPQYWPRAEPTVWIGERDQFDADGSVRMAYPATYMNTVAGGLGYRPKETGSYAYGARELFEADAFGPDFLEGSFPLPTTVEDSCRVFNRTGAMLREAFLWAHQLGVQTCVGTEVPLTIPYEVGEVLRAAGRDPADPREVQAMYEGLFARIEASYPIDYYWLWTPEQWHWFGNTPVQTERAREDLTLAVRAHAAVRPRFQLATCGWVLGPQEDRMLFDRLLPPDVTASCVNRNLGQWPVDPLYGQIQGRRKWAIPWIEDDEALTAPQLWVGRARRDAVDARRYGCEGLIGMHWRTRGLAPTVSALAQAAWDQRSFADWEQPEREGAYGGLVARFFDNPIAGTDDPWLYQMLRYNLSAYRLQVPNGVYTVTLKFCEPFYEAADRRVFQVLLQNQPKVDRLDIFARVGHNRALDLTFTEVQVTNRWLEVRFLPILELPTLAGMVVEGTNVTRKINCGGGPWKDYEGERVAYAEVAVIPPVLDFYLDWATQEFGPEVGAAAAGWFAEWDGRLPRPCAWVDGPGGIRPDARPWSEVAPDYAFVDRLEALAGAVQGAGNRARFRYWLETFRYLRAMARVTCGWGAYNRALELALAEADADARRARAWELAVPARRELVRQVGDVYRHLLATLETTSDLGTLVNWEQQILPNVLLWPGEDLATLLKGPLPADAQPPKRYEGALRIIVPAARTSVAFEEPLAVRLLVLAERPPVEVTLYWRTLGQGAFAPVPAGRVERGVYRADLPVEASRDDFEWHARVVDDRGEATFYPPTAPAQSHTVVVLGAGSIMEAGTNHPPELAPIADQSVSEGSRIKFRLVAVDEEVPVQALHFRLVEAPEGAQVDPVTGVFSWTPEAAQAPGTHRIMVKVTDDGRPPLSATRTFVVVVKLRPCVSFELGASVFLEDGFRLSFRAPAGRYAIWASDDLAQWVALETVTVGDDGAWYLDTSAQGRTRRFYRVEQAP